MKKSGMKHLILLILALASVIAACMLLSSCGSEKTVTLNVYNWGQYISDGSEDSLDVNAAFEDYYYETYGQKIKVNYTTYASNEDMYNKLKSGAASYDIVIPSDYMIERMINEGMLEKLDFDKIPNFKNIKEDFVNPFYDPKNEYSVPYFYGMVGIIYNSTMVDEADMTGWSALWNPKYSGKILQFNNPRDGFGTAMYYQGIDVNTNDPADWQKALDKLLEQKPLVQSYVMDEIFNKMKNGSAAIAPYYAGDFLSMYEDNEYLSFYYPKEGTNMFVDAMCVPTCATHKDIAQSYIDFMQSEDIAVANAEWTYYASPNKLVTENEEYVECMSEVHEDAMEILYPDSVDFLTSYYYTLDDDTIQTENTLWEQLKINSSTEPWVHITTAVIVISLAALFIYKLIEKKRRARFY